MGRRRVRSWFPTQTECHIRSNTKTDLNDPEWLPLMTIEGSGNTMEVTTLARNPPLLSLPRGVVADACQGWDSKQTVYKQILSA